MAYFSYAIVVMLHVVSSYGDIPTSHICEVTIPDPTSELLTYHLMDDKCHCIITNTSEWTYSLSCHNMTGFPVLNNSMVMENVTSIHIERSYVMLIDIDNFYPNIENITLRYNRLLDFDSLNPFRHLPRLQYLTISWMKLDISTFQSIICSLPVGNEYLKVSLNGIFPGPDEIHIPPTNQTVLNCLKTRRIKDFDFRSNDISIKTMENIMCSVSIDTKSLQLGRLFTAEPAYVNKTTFECLRSRPNLRYLQIESLSLVFDINKMDKVFTHLQQIETLDLFRTSSAYTLEPFFMMPKLRKLALGRNDFQQFLDFCKGKGIKSLEELDLRQNSFPRFYTFDGDMYDNLQTLILRQNYRTIQDIPSNFIKNLTKLKYLDLDHTDVAFIYDDSFTSTSLEKVTLNEMVIDLTWLSKTIFQCANSSLNSISMNSINRRKPNPEQVQTVNLFFGNVFRNLGNLRNLNLVAVGLSVIPKTMFEGTPNLIELNLSDNSIEAVIPGGLTMLRSLLLLNLNYNLIQTLNSSVIPQPLDKSSFLTLKVSYNSFKCDCSLYEFRQWMKPNDSSKIKLDDDRKDKYECKLPYVENLVNFNPTYSECYRNNLSLIYWTMVTSALSFAFICLAASTIYRFRWHIYYWHINVRNKKRQQSPNDEEFIFDAFISYNNKDTAWVIRVLRQTLEDKFDLKLCIHDRDWPAGNDIVDNIVWSIENSRKTVLVVSNAFASSNWCQLELTMAQHKLFSQDKDNLILIKKEDLMEELITPRLALQMKQKTYIAWEDGEMAEKVFWKRLVLAIRGHSHSVKHSLRSLRSALEWYLSSQREEYETLSES